MNIISARKELLTIFLASSASSNVDTIKMVAGIVIVILALISVFAYLNLDKNKIKNYFKK